ncbi:MAG TPA: ATP-binding protein [Verrucomicrobiae bacterium]|nr:ATP-binding protein [Verrucomicrobiae bacterium]
MEAIQDVHEANRCIRELAALSLLPAIWSAGEPSHIRDNLAEALRSSLRADIVYVRCRDCEGGKAAICATDIPNDDDLLRSVTTGVDQSLEGRGPDLAKLAVHGLLINLSVFTLGPGQEFGALAVGSRRPDFPTALERILLNVAVNQAIIAFRSAKQLAARRLGEQALKEETRLLEILDKTGKSIAGQLDLEKVVQSVTDSATELTGAKFGAFFYNIVNEQGEALMLYTLSGAPREAFEKLGHPRATALFGPTFRGEPAIRIDDVRKDSRYGAMAPHYGMPKGHLPVVSYLAVPVVSRSGEVIGGLFFGHPEPGVFNERAEKLVVGMAAQAAIAIDNARLYEKGQREIAQRRQVEQALREAQAELHDHAEKLEDQVAQRTAELRETIQQLEAFSYSVSHDMRSPLRAMQGYSDALLDEYRDKLGSTGVEYLTRIRRSASRMDLLIQDVLAYSRVAKGDIQLAPVNIEAVIRDVVQNYPALQSDRADVCVAGPIPPVMGHEAYLTQIVSNLLTNAVKFVESGKKPSVTIRTRAEGEMIRIDFQDNGIGIAEKHQKQIFQIFGRVYSDKMYEGTGIGLAIAKKAAERMGGSLGVKSETGVGSNFFVILKRAS